MAYFAQLDSENTVCRVISISNTVLHEPTTVFPDTEIIGQQFINEVLNCPGNWKQTSYNKTFRKNYAGIGYTYDETRDAFVPPQPYPSWTLNETICRWEPPVPYPADGNMYQWDENTMTWVQTA